MVRVPPFSSPSTPLLGLADNYFLANCCVAGQLFLPLSCGFMGIILYELCFIY